MKIAVMALASMFLTSNSSGELPLATKRGMQVDRVVDSDTRVVCYIAQNTGGSSHTTPSMQCFHLPASNYDFVFKK